MRSDSKKNVEVKYDNVWFTITLVNVISSVLPKIVKFNQTVTYHNKFGQVWREKG